ncbi:MAG: ABC transporter substrate-binding protein [Oscillospiraceae bacterium]|nr:ABC transporter substrate-binding protein [Oscillospiraceae bacterium]
MAKRSNSIIPRAASLTLAALLCFGLLLLPGCGRDDGAGKIIDYPIDEAPQRLDPAIARSASELLVLGNCMEGLLRMDAGGRLLPGVAARWDVSADGRVLTFYLRDDNHWRLPENPIIDLADTQVTAEDFAFGLRRALSPAVNPPGAAAPPGLAALLPILNAEQVRAGAAPESALGVRAVDPFTLEITLDALHPEERAGEVILHALARGAALPCNRAFFEACGGRYGLEPRTMLCNGPFYLNRMEDSLTRLKPNANYSSKPENLALPATVNLWVQPDPLKRARLLGASYDAAVAPQALRAEIPEGAAIRELHNAVLALVFNCAALGDASIRAAMCAALEPGALGYSAFPGLLPGGALAGERNYREAAGPPAGIKYDMERASALAASANEKITLRLICAPEHETLLRRALQAWQRAFRLGMEARIEALEPEELQVRLAAGDFDAAVAQLTMESSSALEALQALEGRKSPARYQSAALETLLRAAAQADDAAGACLQAEEHLLQNGVYYPLEARSGLLLVAQGVEGLEVSPAGDMVYFKGVRKWEK